MNKSLLTLLLGVFASTALLAQQQYAIQFSYDSAGNQTLRDRVCINCGSSKEPIDSVDVVEVDLQDDILKEVAGENELGEGMLVAYPNPVTNLLSVEWIDNQKRVSQIVLFSSIGRQLYKADINKKHGSLDLNFANYPSGRYIVYVQYADRSKKAFHILKK